jgi:acyl carrier protein
LPARIRRSSNEWRIPRRQVSYWAATAMTKTTTNLPLQQRPSDLPEEDIAHLQETLKRCSPATFAAACEFRRTRDSDQLTTVIVGVIERYVERDVRPKLRNRDDNLRLVEDLGIDSLTMMEIVLLAEDVLRISVSNEELCHLRTLGEVRRFIAEKAAAMSQAANANVPLTPPPSAA